MEGGEGLGLGLGSEAGRGGVLRRCEEGRLGTAHEDGWHVARGWPAATTRAARRGTEQGKGKGWLTGGARRDFYFIFSFFFSRVVTTCPNDEGRS